MEVKMLKTATGCDNGVIEKTYETGETYNVSEGLAKCFLDLNVAEKSSVELQEKALTDYQNKALKKAPKNKGE